MSATYLAGNDLSLACNGIAELIKHTRFKRFPEVLGGFLYQYCAFDDLTITAQKQEGTPVLVYAQGERSPEGLLLAYLRTFYRHDPAMDSQRVEGRKVYLYSELKPYWGVDSAYVQGYYQKLAYVDEVLIRVELGGTCLNLSLGRKAGLGKVARSDLKSLQSLYSVLAALLQEYWMSNGSEFDASLHNANPLEVALVSFGQGILTKRERQVSCMILQGQDSKAIARQLNISVDTVKVHRRNIHNRMRTSTQNDLFQLFLSYLNSLITRSAA